MNIMLDRVTTCVVAPFTGVWIETERLKLPYKLLPVAPFTGVWIETNNDADLLRWGRRALHGRVD